jgi:hypothetical protein
MINTPKPKNPNPLATPLVIPRHLPPIVRDVAKSLALRDPESAEKYLQTYQQPRHG